MADQPITRQQLINASEDADDLGVFMNGDSSTDVNVRSGASYPSLAKLITQIGYNVPVNYAAGLNMTSPNQTVLYNDVVYAPIGSQIPFTTSGTFETAKFRVIQGLTKSELASQGGDYLVGAHIIGDGVTDKSSAIATANANGKPLRFTGISKVSSPTTITVPIIDTLEQIFDIDAKITISNGLPVRPEWFGPVGTDVGMIRRAIDALPSTGGIVQLSVARYRSGYDTALPAYFDNRGGTPGVDYMVKPKVRIQGSRLPSYNLTNSALTDGSIIRGTFYVASEASGFQADLIGVDCGVDACNQLYGGADADGFCMLQVNKTSPVYGNYFRIGSVVTLGPGGSTLGHGFLFESIDGGSVDYVESRLHWHGVVIKSRNIKAGTLVGTLNLQENVLLKSDYYATLQNVSVDKVICTGDVGFNAGYGFQILADAAHGSEISVAQVIVDQSNIGTALIANSTFVLADINIGEMMIRSCPTGYKLTGTNLKRSNVNRAKIDTFTSAVVVDAAVTSKDHGIDSLGIAIGTYGVDCSGFVRVGDIHAESVTWAIYHRTSGARIYHSGGYEGVSVTNFWAATPTLSPTWANLGGSNDLYSMGTLGGMVRMAGLLIPGSSPTTTICTLPVNIRPAANLRFPCLAYNGSVWSVVELLIAAATGVVSISATSPTSSYLSLRGVEWEIPF